MPQKKFWFRMSVILAVLAMVLMLPAGGAAASKYKVLHRFRGPGDGQGPYGGLILDEAGNLYGTTVGGGTGYGTVFKLTPNSDGSWTESVLYSFTGGEDGDGPIAGLILDEAGNLYGTTQVGGNGCDSYGCGVVFKLTPNSDGSWTESVLYKFTGGEDGYNIFAGLILDHAGNLYGTAVNGGIGGGGGVVFKLTPQSDGSWTESVLYNFCSITNCADGEYPYADLIFDAAGNLYGATVGGGVLRDCNNGYGYCGVAFRLTPNADGSWKEKVLHKFTGGKDGGRPYVGLIFDQAGNLYGTTAGGGNVNCDSPYGCGTVFKLSPNADGSWKEKVLHKFTGGKDGNLPSGGLIFDAEGNLYGTTANGGNLSYCVHHAGCGVVFKLTPNSDGSWTETVLHFFQGTPAVNPLAPLVLDKAGNLYGTTYSCGRRYNCSGVVFEITP
jgi:uncharacterized repeat protein (TIGR03803 family)